MNPAAAFGPHAAHPHLKDIDPMLWRHRYYEPTIGRMTSLDVYAGEAASPSTLNKYLYCLGSPVNRIDPSGNISLVSLLGYAAIAAMLLASGCSSSTTSVVVAKTITINIHINVASQPSIHPINIADAQAKVNTIIKPLASANPKHTMAVKLLPATGEPANKGWSNKGSATPA